MDGMIHTRSDQWDEMPFASMHELVDFTEELDQIVKEAAPEPPRDVKTLIEYAQGRTGYLSADALRRALPDLAPLPEVVCIYVSSAFVNEDDPAAESDKSAFAASLFLTQGDHFYAKLSVEGRKVTTVEGVRAAAKAAIDKHASSRRQNAEVAAQDGLKQEEEDRERKHRADVASATLKADGNRARERDNPPPRESLEEQRRKARDDVQVSREPSLAARLKRVAYDPWMIGIGTAVIAGIVLAVLLR